MSNNVQTAAQWAQVVAQDQARLDKNLAEQATAVADSQRLRALRDAAKSQLDQVVAATGSPLSPEARASRTEFSKLNSEFEQSRTSVAQYRDLISANRSNVAFAKRQEAAAASGPPNDNSVPPPAGATPNANSDGNNTAVTTPTPSLPVVSTQPAVDPADAAFEQARLNNDEDGQTVRNDNINPATDPGVGGQDLSDEEILARRQASGLSDEEILTRQGKLNTAIIDPPKDWRVRISLARNSNYLYKAPIPGILKPLFDTGGVVFPYTPSVSVGYSAQYDSQTITHSNFKMHNYTGSSVDQVSVTGDFTAQDVAEANYMLAVIHFFRSATKMFYGQQDQNPARGVPPPLLYLSGFGNYQFDNHPMVLTNFTYALPVDVDYINAYPNGTGNAINTVSLAPYNKPNTAKPSLLASGVQRLLGTGLQPGGRSKPPVFVNPPSASNEITRVPTKISIALTFLPIVTRNAITNGFSLRDYANGSLLRGSKNPQNGGGIW